MKTSNKKAAIDISGKKLIIEESLGKVSVSIVETFGDIERSVRASFDSLKHFETVLVSMKMFSLAIQNAEFEIK